MLTCTRVFALLCFFFLGTTSGFAKITLPSLVGDHMVLQQTSQVSVWGKANPRTNLTIVPSWDGKKYTTQTAADGTWSLKISTPMAGGPFSLTLSDGEVLVLNDVMVGEVWVCSGQSNMSMPIIGYKNQPIKDSNAGLLLSNNPNLRLFTVSRTATRTPQDDCVGNWQVSSSQSARVFSAIGFEFGTILEQSLRVPVGIIHSSWGGTPIEAWMSEESLKAFPHAKVMPASDTTKVQPREAAALFNGMIQPLLQYGIRGFLWYQGESNAAAHTRYANLMKTMITDWRTRWGQGDSPFYYVQIAPYKYPNEHNNSPYLREAQLRVMQQVPATGMAVALDVGEEMLIHPADKSTISKRLAYWALAKTYGWEGLAYSGPVYKAMKTDGTTAQLVFEHASNGLTAFGKELTGFELAGSDRIFHPAQAEITATGIKLTSPQVQTPVAARYAFKDWVVGSLYNVEGLPASSFRTDDWEK